jgi:hypothetical protein
MAEAKKQWAEIENFERIDSEMTKSLEVLSISPIKQLYHEQLLMAKNCSL